MNPSEVFNTVEGAMNETSTLSPYFSSSTPGEPIALPLVSDANMTVIGDACKNATHKMLTTSDYVKLLWTTLAEFPGNNKSYLLIIIMQ